MVAHPGRLDQSARQHLQPTPRLQGVEELAAVRDGVAGQLLAGTFQVVLETCLQSGVKLGQAGVDLADGDENRPSLER
jgi:hypothetical protein